MEPILLSVKNPRDINEPLSNEIPSEEYETFRSRIFPKLGFLKILKLIKINPDNFIVPDLKIGWVVPTYYKALKIYKKCEFQRILISCPPFSSAIIGLMLKRKLKISAILDLRDSWTTNPYKKYNIFSQRINQLIEKKCIENYDKIVCATHTIKNDYLKKYPDMKEKFSVIYNAVDLDELPRRFKPKNKTFTIISVGHLYHLRDPKPFIKGLTKAIRKEKLKPEQIRFVNVGIRNKELKNVFKNENMEPYLKEISYIPKRECLKLIQQADMSLLIEYSSALTSKVFDYLSFNNPILALTKSNEMRDLIKKYSKKSIVISEKNADKISDAILYFYNHKRTTSQINGEFLRNVNARNEIKRLIEEIN